MDVGEEGNQHDDPGASAQLAGFTRLRKGARDAPRCSPRRLHVQRDGRKDLVEATSRSSGRRCICQPIVARKNAGASAKEYDDQVGDADGDDAADGGQQQDALKSGHFALLGRLTRV
jgi:hypothetical protein